MNSCTILLLLAGFALAHGVIQEFEFYFEPSQGGTSITWREKIPDLKDWKIFLAKVKSYCATGRFYFYRSTNFYGIAAIGFGSGVGNEGRSCINSRELSVWDSVRFLGPADTRTIAISIYEGSSGTFMGGTEVVVEGRAATNFPMSTTAYLVSNGKSNWTLFTEDNFGGTSWCFCSNGSIFQELQLNATHPVRSVVRDCDSQSVSRNIHEYQMGI